MAINVRPYEIPPSTGLNDFVEISDFKNQPEKLAAILTEAGLEVEGQTSPADSLRNIIIAQIKTIGRHPNATRLSLCEVEEADSKVLKNCLWRLPI